jgi:predicted nucleotidyltransferase/uncharacterized protein with HEPN domain
MARPTPTLDTRTPGPHSFRAGASRPFARESSMQDQVVLTPPDRLAANLLDLRLHAGQIQEFLTGSTREAFLADDRLRAATMFNLVRIAETVRRLAPDDLARLPDVNWSALGRFTAERAYRMTAEDWHEAWRIAGEEAPALLRLDLPIGPEQDEATPPGTNGGKVRLDLPAEELADFCRRWRVEELAVFGSALRDDFRPDSDVAFLVTFEPDAPWSLFDHVRMQDELAERLGRKVDLVERRAVESSPNWIRRRAILSSARPLVFYARS